MHFLRFTLFSVLFVALGCTASKTAAPVASYAGTYAVVVKDTPLGTINSDLMITEAEDGTLSGSFVQNGQTLKLKSVAKTEGGMRFAFYYPEAAMDVDVDLRGAPGAEMLIGETLGEYATTATRKE